MCPVPYQFTVGLCYLYKKAHPIVPPLTPLRFNFAGVAPGLSVVPVRWSLILSLCFVARSNDVRQQGGRLGLSEGRLGGRTSEFPYAHAQGRRGERETRQERPGRRIIVSRLGLVILRSSDLDMRFESYGCYVRDVCLFLTT